MKDLQKLMDDITEWCDKTFVGNQRNPAIIAHLKKEVKELHEALLVIDYAKKVSVEEQDGLYTERVRTLQILSNSTKARDEYADCMMLLLESASRFGYTAERLLEDVRVKLEKNKLRKWGQPDKDGVIEHIKEEKK